MATYPFWRISESVTKQELGTFNQLYPYPKYLPRWHTFFSSVDEEVPQEVIVEKTFLDERLLRHIRLQVSLLNLNGGGRCRCGVGGRAGRWPGGRRGLHPRSGTSIYLYRMHRLRGSNLQLQRRLHAGASGAALICCCLRKERLRRGALIYYVHTSKTEQSQS